MTFSLMIISEMATLSSLEVVTGAGGAAACLALESSFYQRIDGRGGLLYPDWRRPDFCRASLGQGCVHEKTLVHPSLNFTTAWHQSFSYPFPTMLPSLSVSLFCMFCAGLCCITSAVSCIKFCTFSQKQFFTCTRTKDVFLVNNVMEGTCSYCIVQRTMVTTVVSWC